MNAIVSAAYNGDQAGVESALAMGGNVNDADAQGNTAMHYAAGRGYDAIAMILAYVMTSSHHY